MRFVRFGPAGAETPGVIASDGSCFDISALVGDIGPEAIADIGETVRRVNQADNLPVVDLSATRIGSPIGRPRKIIAVGLNYADHVAEANMEMPTEPVVFMKATSSICGPNDDVIFPRGATKLDWEIELGVVVANKCRYLGDEDDGQRSIAGYVIVNDVSERAFQLERGGQWVKGKSADTFTPVGPWFVTADEIADPLSLDMSLAVNGELRQNASTATMIFSPAYCVWYLSQFMTLEPGDLVLTGTPPGVGLATGQYLEPGDTMELKISGTRNTNTDLYRRGADMTWESIDSGAGGMPFSLATDTGNFVFVSGQASVDETGAIVSGTFEQEMRRALGNLQTVLRSAGVELSDVVRVTGYVRDPANLPRYNEIYREYFSDPFPARTTLTNCLPDTLHFEIDAIAFRP